MKRLKSLKPDITTIGVCGLGGMALGSALIDHSPVGGISGAIIGGLIGLYVCYADRRYEAATQEERQ